MEEIVINVSEGAIVASSEEAAEEAGLRYVNDSTPGWRRKRTGKGFVFFDISGSRITNHIQLRRIKNLRIPPAWREVWICPVGNGHIQATGVDAKGRKQYIYHPKWHEIRNSSKFSKITHFAEILPSIRQRIEYDLRQRNLSKVKVAALVVSLLEKTLIRVGNIEYSRENDSYGLTTLKNEHIDVDGNKIKFYFKGKSGKHWELNLHDRRLARLVRQCQELPGQELFQYIDEEGELQTISSQDINQYLKEITGFEFTAKDFRTWGGTVHMARTLYDIGPSHTEREAKRNITKAIKESAKKLCNTPSVCRKYYVHPLIIDAYNNGSLFEELGNSKKQNGSRFGLDEFEMGVVRIIKNSDKNRN